jgi:hypothetical protein
MLKKSSKLVELKIKVDQDYSREVREIRRELIRYLKNVRSRGYKVFMRTDKLVVNSRLYSLNTFYTV